MPEIERCEHNFNLTPQTCALCLKKAEEKRISLIKKRNKVIKNKEVGSMDGFEMFVKEKNINVNVPMIYCSKATKIYFNASAARKYPIKKFKGVVLFYNPNKKIIGIQLSNNIGAPGFLKLSYSAKYSAGFSSKAFMQKYKIKSFGQTPVVKSDLREDFYIAELK